MAPNSLRLGAELLLDQAQAPCEMSDDLSQARPIVAVTTRATAFDAEPGQGVARHTRWNVGP